MCTLGIQRIVNREVKKKPYLRYNGTDFITIPLVGEINSINVMGIARSLAEQFNKKINDGKNIGKVFYAEQGSDVTGVGIRPTPSQLTVLNQPNNNLYRYFDSKESTATEVLEKIEKLGGGLGAIAKKLLENPINVPVIIVDSDEVTENVQAHYDQTDKVIRVAKDAKFHYSTESLLVHEILHAYTSSYLVSDAGAKERQQLQDVLDYLKSDKISNKIKDKYPLGNVEELLVGIFTNPSLIRDLKQIPARSNSFAFVWNEILDIFKSIFGIKDATMFDEVFNISSQIVDSSTKNRDNEEQDRQSALAMYYDYEENSESAEDEIEREIMESERDAPEKVYIKQDVLELFESNPDLSSIGTAQQYSQYLDTVFTNSKVKDIVYHGSIYSNKQKFDKSTRVTGYYFATTQKNALQHAERQLSNPEDATLYRILLNLQNPRIISKVIDYEDLDTEAAFTKGDDIFGYDADGIIAEQVEEYNTTYKRPETTWIEKQIVVFEPEQIHILGSKQDKEEFKKWVDKNTATSSISKTLLQKQNSNQTKANKNTQEKVKEFLRRAGVNIVDIIKYAKEHNLDISGINGLADTTRGLIAVVNGKEDEAITEEAMHIAVAIIKQKNPTLYKQLTNEVVKYGFYKAFLEEYRENKLYQKDGKPDFDKLKEEAVGKLLAEYFINKSENLSEKPENMVKIQSMWERVKEFLKSLIGKTNIDVFAQALSEVESGNLSVSDLKNGDVFLQTNETQDAVVGKIKAMNNNIAKKLSPTLKDENGKPKDSYFYNGVEMLNRVTDKAKKFYEKIFRGGDVNKSEYQKLLMDLYSENGTLLHEDQQHIIGELTDAEGKFVDRPFQFGKYKPKTTIQIYETLYENMRDRMKLYPGSVFLSEVMLADSAKSIGGTSDLLVIKPDGSIKILDWKFMDMQTDKFQDVAWYKKKAFDIQISEYRRIISEQFGIPLSKITGEAIPIKTNYVYTREMVNGKQVLPKLTGVIIGEADPKLEENDYLLPVPISSQSTGDAELDKLLKQLSALKANMESVTVKSAEEKEAKAEQINAIEKAMRHIAVKQSLTPLVDQAEVYTKDVRDIVDTFNELYKDLDFAKVYATDKEQFTKDVNDFGLRLDRALDQIKIYSALDVDLSEFFGTDVSEEAQELQEKIAEVTKTARFLEKGLLNTINAFAEKIAEAEGSSKITSAETQVTGSSKLLSETSKLQMKTLQVFYAKRRAAQNEAEVQTNEEILQLKKLGEAYEKLALSKGLTKKNMFNLIMDYNENKLINQYSKEFYDLLKEKVAVATRDYKWIEENVDVAAFKAAMQEKLDAQIELIENKNISDEEKEMLIENKIKSFDTSKTDSPGWYNNYPLLSQFPLSKWESTEWKTMNATGNEAAVELYNWVLKINKKANDIGYLPQGNSARNFLPYVVKSFAEKMVFGGNVTLGEEFIRSMTIDEDSVGYGAIDKLTNKPINKIPKYFTNKSDKELSVNLIKNLGLYNQALNNYKFISETEGIARVLSRVERNKGSIVTDKIGNAVFDKNTGTFETSTSNESNADLFDKQIATLVYGQKYVQSESFDQLLGSVGDSFEKVNKVLGFKLLPEGLKDRQFSLNKSLDTLNRYFQQKTLGFNPLPAISNLVGGKLQLTISSGKYMTKADVMKADLSLLGAAVSGEKGKKLIAALKYFLPFTSNETNQELIKKLSVTDLTEHHIQELLMVMMRSSDKYIQATIFSALFDNSALIDGNIYNAREYVRNNTDYKDRYASGNLEEQEDKFNSLVEELLKKHSLESQSSINDKGELVIKGLERSSAQAFALKNLSQALNKRATGSLTNAEVRGMNQNILSNSFMVFKNWIPSLIDVRFGKMKYASDVDAYEWGRTRTVARIMSREGLSSISTLVDLLSFNTFALSNSGKIVKANKTGLEQLEELYVYKKQQYLQQTGRELDMTKAEFFDMVRQNIRNQAKDTLITLSLIAMFLALKANVPDKDEDEDIKNRHKFMVKVLDRLSDEVSFYYSPTSFQTILNGSVMPSIGLLTDGANVLSHFMKEMYDLGVGDDKAAEKNYVWKYVFRSFPLVSQMSTYMPLYAPELAKDLGIKSTAQARR